MTGPTITLADLTVDVDGHGTRRIWDNTDPRRPVALDESDLVELVARVLLWAAASEATGEPSAPISLTDLVACDPVEVVGVADGAVWFVKPVNPHRVQLGIVRHDDREWVVDLDPNGISIELIDGRYVIEHLDYEDAP